MPIALRRRNLPQLTLQAREALMSRFRPVLHAHGATARQVRESPDTLLGPLAETSPASRAGRSR